MNNEIIIKECILKNLKTSVSEISKLGNGACGSVYRVKLDTNKIIAVKVSEHAELMLKEYEMLSFLKNKTTSKIPDIYYYDNLQNKGIIAMQYINGISGASKSLKYRLNKKQIYSKYYK